MTFAAVGVFCLTFDFYLNPTHHTVWADSKNHAKYFDFRKGISEESSQFLPVSTLYSGVPNKRGVLIIV